MYFVLYGISAFPLQIHTALLKTRKFFQNDAGNTTFPMVPFTENKIAFGKCFHISSLFGAMSGNYYQATWHRTPEDSTLHSHHCVDLYSHRKRV